MPYTPLTYRLAPALLALALVLTSAGPLLNHLCMGDAQHAAMMEAAVTEQAHPCCGDHCPGHPDTSPEDVPSDDACCVVAPAVPAESVAVASPVAPRADAALFAVVATLWAEVVEAPPARPALADTGGPPLPVRSHLALSILLI
jgi:hypothetical protein